MDAAENTGTPMASGTGEAALSAARTRRPRIHHQHASAKEPAAHIVSMIGTGGIEDEELRGAGVGRIEALDTNGSFTCSMTTGTLEGRGAPVLCDPPNWLSASINKEKGTKNFAEAASHRQ